MVKISKLVIVLGFSILIVSSSIFGLLILINNSNEQKIRRTDSFTYKGVNIERLLCNGFRIKYNNTVIYTDPYNLDLIEAEAGKTLDEADYIFITHANHMDHMSVFDIFEIANNETVIIGPMNSASNGLANLGKEIVLANGTARDIFEYDDAKFEIVPMYNVNKYRSGGSLFHPPEDGGIGAIIEIGGVRIYQSGSTDVIPEMKEIKTDIALLVVGGYAFMTPQEAATAVDYLKINSELKYAIPQHYGYLPNFLGEAGAESFAEMANCSVVILDNGVTSKSGL